MFGCCCNRQPTTYKVKGVRCNSITGFASVVVGGPLRIVQTVPYNQIPAIADAAVAEKIHRRFLKKTEVLTSNLGYTQTTVSEYDNPVDGSLTTTTTYVPDEATFSADWSLWSSLYATAAGQTVGPPEVHFIERAGEAQNWRKETTFENPVSDGAVFSRMKEIADALPWSSVVEFYDSEQAIPHLSYWRPVLGWYTGTSGWYDVYAYLIMDWYNKNPWLSSVKEHAQPVAGYGMRSVRRKQDKLDYILFVAKVDGSGCVQVSELDANGCPTTVALYKKMTDEMDAPAIDLSEVAPESPVWGGSYWAYPSGGAVTQFARSAMIPFCGAPVDSGAGCAVGYDDKFYRFGAQLNVPTGTGSTCSELPPP